jgi:electron transfer flavoprotein beta subunit
MKIVVCMSNVPDTTTKVKFSGDNKTIDSTGIQWIINPWDELALTRALELKDANAGAIENVTVAMVGDASSEPTIRKALAIGADNGIRVNAVPADAYSVAFQMAEALKPMNFDVILCGIESSDYNGSAVGAMLAEFMGLTSVSSVSALNIENGEMVLNREIDGGSEVLGVKAPFVAIVQKGIAIEPRIPSMRGIMQARTKPLTIVEATACETLTEISGLEMPGQKSACKMVDPENVKELVNLLHNEAKVI